MLDAELEVRVVRPGAVVGEAGVFVEQGVDVGGLPLARAPPHRQHVLDDLVGALAVLADALEVAGEIACDLVDQRAALLVFLFVLPVALAGRLQLLQKLLQQLFRDFREVLDEVQRVPDLVSDARGQLAKGGQLLPHDDLVLGAVQAGQRIFELRVLALELVGELLHQVQTLDLQGVAAEDLEGGGHVRHLVAPADVDLGLQVAAGHAPHPLRKPREAPQQHAADEQPGDQHGAHDADHAEREQQIAPGQDGLGGGVSRLLGVGAGGVHQALGLGDQFDGELAVAGEQVALTPGEGDLLRTQVETQARAEPQFDEPGEGRPQPVPQGTGPDRRQAAFDLADGGLETFTRRLQQGRVGDVEGAGEELDRDGRVGLEPGQVAVAGELRLRQVAVAGRRRCAERPVARHRVEQLIVDGRDQEVVEGFLQGRNFRQQCVPALAQKEALGHRVFDRREIGGQGAAAVADTREPLLVGVVQVRHRGLEDLAVLGDLGGGLCEVRRCRGGRQARGGRDQRAAQLRHPEGRRHLRNAALVHPALEIAHPVEEEPADQGGDDGERDGAPQSQIELGGDAEAALDQPFRPAAHGAATGRSDSIGW